MRAFSCKRSTKKQDFFIHFFCVLKFNIFFLAIMEHSIIEALYMKIIVNIPSVYSSNNTKSTLIVKYTIIVNVLLQDIPIYSNTSIR